jgi:hypothetical protein
VGQLTRTILFNLLCRNRKDTKNLNHNLNDRVRHSNGQGDLYIGLEPSKDVFYAREEVGEFASTVANTVYSL